MTAPTDPEPKQLERVDETRDASAVSPQLKTERAARPSGLGGSIDEEREENGFGKIHDESNRSSLAG